MRFPSLCRRRRPGGTASGIHGFESSAHTQVAATATGWGSQLPGGTVRSIRSLVVIGSLALVGSCGGGGSSPSAPSPTTGAEVGTYALLSLNGIALPTSISEGSIQIEVTSGALTIGVGNTVRTSTTFRPGPGAAPVTNEVSGTYSIQGSTLSISYSNGGRSTATLNGGALQMVNEGVTWLYRRA